MKNIYYIGYYTKINNPNSFITFPSCNNKMGYIIDALKKLNYYVYVYSLGEGPYLRKAKKEEVDSKEMVYYVGTFPFNNSLFKMISRIWMYLQLFYFVSIKIKKQDKLIVYHTYAILWLIKFIRIYKKFELIYEVEEIYNAAWKKTDNLICKEIDYLKIADKFILVNDIMKEICGFDKPSISCYGNYTFDKFDKRGVSLKHIYIVYAGVIGNRDSDVYLAINSMKYLPSNYYLNIIGYGSEKSICDLQKYLEDNIMENICYDGLLSGKEYQEYLLNCDIGLSPRLLEDNLSNYTFPSKVLSYLTHNLITVSSKISSIYHSEIAEAIYFIEDLTPKGVANTILEIDFDNLKDISVVKGLDEKFRYALKELILL